MRCVVVVTGCAGSVVESPPVRQDVLRCVIDELSAAVDECLAAIAKRTSPPEVECRVWDALYGAFNDLVSYRYLKRFSEMAEIQQDLLLIRPYIRRVFRCALSARYRAEMRRSKAVEAKPQHLFVEKLITLAQQDEELVVVLFGAEAEIHLREIVRMSRERQCSVASLAPKEISPCPVKVRHASRRSANRPCPFGLSVALLRRAA